MLAKIIQRIGFAILLLLGCGIVISLLLSFVIDSSDAYINKTIGERFYENITTLLKFDYGYTKNENAPILSIILDRSQKSLILMSGALGLTLLIGVPTGILSALKGNSVFVNIWTSTLHALSSIPILVWTPLLLMISMRGCGVFPIYTFIDDYPGFSLQKSLFYLLPIFALTFGDGILSDIIRTLKTETAKVLEQGYYRAVRARNASLVKHFIYSLGAQIISIFSNKTSYLISGTIIVEVIYNWKGLAYQILTAVRGKDYPLILAVTMVFVTLTVLLNLVSEITALATNPRLRKS